MSQTFPFLEGSEPATTDYLRERPWDQVLHETDHFVVVPTVGALVEGWLLIITKQPYLCMGGMPTGEFHELSSLKELVCSVLSECYGDITVFEHGPSQPGQGVGCGVDHAHLHVLPAICQLTQGVPAVTKAVLEWDPVEGPLATKRYSLFVY